LDNPGSTLSHHLQKLKHENLVKVRREATFLWYSADTEELLSFSVCRLEQGDARVKAGSISGELITVSTARVFSALGAKPSYGRRPFKPSIRGSRQRHTTLSNPERSA
jgi:hypothetical protein